MFFDIIKPRRIEHLQSEEPFSSDPYFRPKNYICTYYMFTTFSWGLNCSNFKFCFIKKTMQDFIKRTLLRKNLEGESFLLLFNTILYAFLSILVDTIDG